MERITINAEFLFELKSKNEWVQRVPQILPEKTRSGEKLIWIDAVGNVFESGRDFEAAERLSTYPCKVYRPYHVDSGFAPQPEPVVSEKATILDIIRKQTHGFSVEQHKCVVLAMQEFAHQERQQSRQEAIQECIDYIFDNFERGELIGTRQDLREELEKLKKKAP